MRKPDKQVPHAQVKKWVQKRIEGLLRFEAWALKQTIVREEYRGLDYDPVAAVYHQRERHLADIRGDRRARKEFSKRMGSKLLPLYRPTIVKLLEEQGMAIRVGKQTGPTWDGKTLRAHQLANSDLVHELGHFLVAPSSRQRLPNFGLGPLNEWDKGVKRRVNQKTISRDEKLASVVGGLIAAAHDWDFREVLGDRLTIRNEKELTKLLKTATGYLPAKLVQSPGIEVVRKYLTPHHL